MNIRRERVEKFAVLGKLGSTADGKGFIQQLWKEANEKFNEVKPYAKKDKEGRYIGFWGLMSDFSLDFKPWKDYKEGYYLAGVEVKLDAPEAEGWTKWVYPGSDFVVVKVDHEYQEVMAEGLDYIKENGLHQNGAIFDFMNPKENGQLYLFFPVLEQEV